MTAWSAVILRSSAFGGVLASGEVPAHEQAMNPRGGNRSAPWRRRRRQQQKGAPELEDPGTHVHACRPHVGLRSSAQPRSADVYDEDRPHTLPAAIAVTRSASWLLRSAS